MRPFVQFLHFPSASHQINALFFVNAVSNSEKLEVDSTFDFCLIALAAYHASPQILTLACHDHSGLNFSHCAIHPSLPWHFCTLAIPPLTSLTSARLCRLSCSAHHHPVELLTNPDMLPISAAVASAALPQNPGLYPSEKNASGNNGTGRHQLIIVTYY